MYYLLDQHMNVVPCADVLTWARAFEDTQARRVALDAFGEVEVSTVFLGLDHRFVGSGPPIVFETMVFGMGEEEMMRRYATWQEAKAGHAQIAREVKHLVEEAHANAADVLLALRQMHQ